MAPSVCLGDGAVKGVRGIVGRVFCWKMEDKGLLLPLLRVAIFRGFRGNVDDDRETRPRLSGNLMGCFRFLSSAVVLNMAENFGLFCTFASTEHIRRWGLVHKQEFARHDESL